MTYSTSIAWHQSLRALRPSLLSLAHTPINTSGCGPGVHPCAAEGLLYASCSAQMCRQEEEGSTSAPGHACQQMQVTHCGCCKNNGPAVAASRAIRQTAAVGPVNGTSAAAAHQQGFP
jgi:hypothetical protein